MANSQSLQLQKRLASLLEASIDIQSLRKLHSFIFHHGYGDNDFLGSKVLTAYAKFGFLNESRLVFDKIVNERLTFWNAVLVGYFKSGHFDEVISRYLCLKRRKIGLDSSSITFCVKSCVELGEFDFGRCVHGDGIKFGLNRSGFLASSLIGFYKKCEDIFNARKVFDEITERDVVAYTSMISGYAHTGGQDCIGAFQIARDMQLHKLLPNRVTLLSLLQASAHVKGIHEGASVHGYAIRRSIGLYDEIFTTSLIDMYMKCCVPQKAWNVSKSFANKTVAINALISGHIQNGNDPEALRLFTHLTTLEKSVADLVTLANGLVGCGNLKSTKEGKSIHGYITRNGIKLDLVATTALLRMYSRCGNLATAMELFEAVSDKDVVLINVMLTCNIENGLWWQVLKMFVQFFHGGVTANRAAILSVLAASSHQRDATIGKMVHGHVIRKWNAVNIEVDNQIISMYSKLGFVEYARRVFEQMKYKDLVSWTSMITAEDSNKAVSVFRKLLGEKLELDSVIFTTLLKAVAQLCNLNLVREIHSHVYRIQIDSEPPLANSLITAYAKCGKFDTSRILFERDTDKLLPSWNAIIAAYGTNGECKEALLLFDKMRDENVKPDETTLASLLSACSHSGQVEDGIRIFQLITEEHNVTLNGIHYCCVIDLLSRAGKLEEAYNLLTNIPMEINVSSMSSLLSGCKVHNNVEIGEKIGKKLMRIDPDKSSSHSLMSSIYAETERWNEVADVRFLLKDSCTRITSGYSMIDLN